MHTILTEFFQHDIMDFTQVECLHLASDFLQRMHCTLYCNLLFVCERYGARSVHTLLYLLTLMKTSFISHSNKYTQSHSVASFICLSSVLHLFEFPRTLCSSSQCSHAAGLWASNSTVFRAPLSSLGFREARRGCARPHQHPGSPAALMALGRRHEQEDLSDLLSAAVTRCLQPESYQAQQSDKPPVQG